MNSTVLVHYGIKGQRWGVRRYQNADGSRTSLGLAHDREIYAQQTGGSNKNTSAPAKKNKFNFDKNRAKTVGKVVLATATVAAAAYMYSRNKDQIDGMISRAGSNITSKFTKQKNVEAGDEYLKKMFADADKHHSLQYKLAKTQQKLKDYSSPENISERIRKSRAAESERAKKRIEAHAAKVKFKAEQAKKLKAELDKLDEEYGLEKGTTYKEYTDSLLSTKVQKATTAAAKAASNSKNQISKAAATVKNVSVKRSNKSEPTKWQKTKSSLKRKAATTAVAAVARKKMDRVMEAKLYGDRKLAQQREENRHQEEMERIKRGKKK